MIHVKPKLRISDAGGHRCAQRRTGLVEIALEGPQAFIQLDQAIDLLLGEIIRIRCILLKQRTQRLGFSAQSTQGANYLKNLVR